MKAIILAGGGGTRLWPVSRSIRPKQVVSVIGSTTLLAATFARLRKGFAAKDILVSTSEENREAVRVALPALPPANLIAEPCRRETAAAIGFALAHIARRAPDETFVTINADAYVRDVPAYHRAIRAAEAAVLAKPDRTALVGIEPTYPETGYGYMKIGRRLRLAGAGEAYEVERFVEKPDLVTAARYFQEGGYLWNPTLVVGKVRHFLGLYDKHLPEHAARLKAIAAALGRPGAEQVIRRQFSRIPPVSIDYGILEKESGLMAVKAEFGWADVGNWRTVREILARKPDDNVVRGLHVGVDSNRNLIVSSSGKLVATAGVSDMVIVETADAILVCPQDRAHDVKKLVATIKGKRGLRKYL
ncbi:mannose-1-phosphate guanylyltransferase [Candidatus Uhrbacteria bacterium]|nr:mannose-1-phosphate guanylyltransferase [Candidatus Uhrbacteria bacterium]